MEQSWTSIMDPKINASPQTMIVGALLPLKTRQKAPNNPRTLSRASSHRSTTCLCDFTLPRMALKPHESSTKSWYERDWKTFGFSFTWLGMGVWRSCCSRTSIAKGIREGKQSRRKSEHIYATAWKHDYWSNWTIKVSVDITLITGQHLGK